MTNPNPTHTRSRARHVALALALILYGWLQVWIPITPPQTGQWFPRLPIIGLVAHANDFKHMYFGARLLRDGADPYDAETMLHGIARDYRVSVNPYVYLPFTAQILTPLSFLPLEPAKYVWFAINHLLFLMALGLMAWTLAQTGARREWIFTALVLTAAIWYPLSRTLVAGQLTCVLFFCIVLYWMAAERGWAFVAGTSLAFAALFKISPTLLVVLLILQRRWRILIWAIVSGVVMLSLSVWACGWEQYAAFAPVLQEMGYGKSVWAEYGNLFYRDDSNVSFNALFHRLFAVSPQANSPIQVWTDLGPEMANHVTRGLALCVLGGLIACVGFGPGRTPWREVWQRIRGNPDATATDKTGSMQTHNSKIINDLDLALGVTALLMIPSLFWDHYTILLLIPMTLLLRQAANRKTYLVVASAALLAGPPHAMFTSWSSGAGADLLLYNMGLWATLLLFIHAGVVRWAHSD